MACAGFVGRFTPGNNTEPQTGRWELVPFVLLFRDALPVIMHPWATVTQRPGRLRPWETGCRQPAAMQVTYGVLRAPGARILQLPRPGLGLPGGSTRRNEAVERAGADAGGSWAGLSTWQEAKFMLEQV